MKITTLLIPGLLALVVATAGASNSNARPSESYAIGERPAISSSITDMAETPERMPTQPFHEMVNAMKVIAGNDMSTNICEYLTYKDYAHINGLSKHWRFMMKHCLANEGRLLVLPESNKLIERLNMQFAKAAEDPTARLAVVADLITLCQRSYYPGGTLYDAFKLYQTNVPEHEQICTFPPSGENGCFTHIFRRTGVYQNSANCIRKVNETDWFKAINARFDALVAVAETLRPILKKWLPYGVLLKLASLYPVGEGWEIKHTFRRLDDPLFNFLMAPHTCDITPILPRRTATESDDHVYQTDSDRVYQRANHSYLQRIEEVHKRIQRLKSFKNDNSAAFSESLKQRQIELITYIFTGGNSDSPYRYLQNLDDDSYKQVTVALDAITNSEYHLLDLMEGNSGRDYRIPRHIQDCLHTILGSPTRLYATSTKAWSADFMNAADCCSTIAANTPDNSTTSKIFHRKAAYFWNRYFDPNTAAEHAKIRNKPYPVDDYNTAIAAQQNAAKLAETATERKTYERAALKLKFKKALHKFKTMFSRNNDNDLLVLL